MVDNDNRDIDQNEKNKIPSTLKLGQNKVSLI